MYKLHWRKSVSRLLLDRCARAEQSLRDAILDAMGKVEETLHNEPDFAGESRDAGKRFLIVKPLSVTYKSTTDVESYSWFMCECIEQIESE